MYRVKAQSGLLWHRISATHVSASLRIFLPNIFLPRKIFPFDVMFLLRTGNR
jgi:hypothetical protein